MQKLSHIFQPLLLDSLLLIIGRKLLYLHLIPTLEIISIVGQIIVFIFQIFNFLNDLGPRSLHSIGFDLQSLNRVLITLNFLDVALASLSCQKVINSRILKLCGTLLLLLLLGEEYEPRNECFHLLLFNLLLRFFGQQVEVVHFLLEVLNLRLLILHYGIVLVE